MKTFSIACLFVVVLLTACKTDYYCSVITSKEFIPAHSVPASNGKLMYRRWIPDVYRYHIKEIEDGIGSDREFEVGDTVKIKQFHSNIGIIGLCREFK